MRVGFIGLGAIGTPMAARLATLHELAVWNRTGSKAQSFAQEHSGARHAGTLRELAAGADAVITCLPTSADVSALCDGPDGLFTVMQRGSILIDCTSGDPATSRLLAARFAEQGIEFVDAPVSGGPPLAQQGKLTVMCGGSAAAVERAAAIVGPFAGRVVRMGDVGAGHAMKAVNNALLAINILSLGEGLVALAKAGIAPRTAVEVLNASSGRSFVSEALIPERVLTGTWPRMFRLALLEKDVGIAHDLAKSVGISDPVLAHTRERYRALRAALGESADYLDPIRADEAAAGVELRG